MANSSRITRGNAPRVLQYGLDAILDQNGKDYKGVGDRLFEVVKTDKGYYEMMQLAGMGIAARKGEGDAISYDSVDQHWVFRIPVFTYEKSARVTREMLKDNVYENLLPRIAREKLKALAHNRDLQQANILNRAFTAGYTYGDAKVLCATDHPTQAGATNSNRLASDSDLSEDAIETASILIDNMINDDGLKSNYVSKKLIVPVALKFEAVRILKSPARVGTPDNDANVLKMDGYIEEIVVWKRLTDSDAWFISTDAENGLLEIRREGIYTQESMDPYTHDTILTTAERAAWSVGDHRCIVGTPGA